MPRLALVLAACLLATAALGAPPAPPVKPKLQLRAPPKKGEPLCKDSAPGDKRVICHGPISAFREAPRRFEITLIEQEGKLTPLLVTDGLSPHWGETQCVLSDVQLRMLEFAVTTNAVVQTSSSPSDAYCPAMTVTK